MDTNKIIDDLQRRHPALEVCRGAVESACEAVVNSYEEGGKVLTCGNGGSAADADHIVGELMKSFEGRRPLDESLWRDLTEVDPSRGAYLAEKLQTGLPAISLNAHTALITAVANDIDPALIFAQQVAAYGREEDILIALTTSGNSRNVVDAAITAKAMGMTVIGMTGEGGGKLKEFADILIAVPARRTAEVQEYHLPVYHAICKAVEETFFGTTNDER
jgi:D-sedoheptulose 7-phosphate isomerase